MIASFICLLIYFNVDPMKGSFFLVLGLMVVVPLISINIHV